MANEFRHGDVVSGRITEVEYEAVGEHIFNSQATGDIMYASSGTQLSRLGVGTNGEMLYIASGIPAWFDGLTFSNDGTKTTILGKTGDYTRFGDANTTSHSFASEDDVVVTGKLEINNVCYFDHNAEHLGNITMLDGTWLYMGSSSDYWVKYSDVDADAFHLEFGGRPAQDARNKPVFIFGHDSIRAVDLSLFEIVTQPTIGVVEKDGKYTSSSTGTCDGADLDELTETGKFTNSVVGDIVRILSGTNVTAGWYRIKVITDNDNVDLDRDFSTGASTNIAFVAYHKLGIYSSEGPALPAKYTDFVSGDFELYGAGIHIGYQLTDNELQVILPDGSMKAVALA